MSRHPAIAMLCLLVLSGFGPAAGAQAWSAEQQEVWAVEEAQWKLSAAEDLSWIDTMVHPNVSYWDRDQPVPQNRAALLRWNRYSAAHSTVVEQELKPLSIAITGNVAVVSYYYQVARQDDDRKTKVFHGRYMDILVKEKGKWLFLAWAGGDDPQP